MKGVQFRNSGFDLDWSICRFKIVGTFLNYRSHDTETFDTLLGDSQDQEQLPLENYKDGAGEASIKQKHNQLSRVSIIFVCSRGQSPDAREEGD